MAAPFLTDAEVDDICKGLEQHAAQIRYLRRLGLLVQRKPNGRALVARSEFERVLGAGRFAGPVQTGQAAGPNVGALMQVIQGGRRGQKTQGR